MIRWLATFYLASSFLREIAHKPEYEDVDVSYTHRKGERVYLKGTVATKDVHDRLM